MSRVISASLSGVDGVAVEVEVRLSSQIPRIDIVGLPEAAVRESAARVRAAIGSSGERFPDRRITVNLAPAGVKKSGAGLDLAIAVGILAANAQVPAGVLEELGLLGELALDGRIRPVRGALAMALAVRDGGCRALALDAFSAREAALAPGLEVRAAAHLGELLAALRGGTALPITEAALPSTEPRGPELADVRGQERGKRALSIAAAGCHAVLLSGPPGSGKTMLAQRLPALLPPLRFEEALEVTRIHGAAGTLPTDAAVLVARPSRAPHHSASRAGLLGGGSPPRPGEVSLAHRGVLFLDELPEFERHSLEALRQVLEDRRVVIARARGSCVFPADFQLVAAANPCPCGWRLSRVRDCRCDDGAVDRYARRLSGPLLDRIDLHVAVPAVLWSELSATPSGPTSAQVRAQVEQARTAQLSRARALSLPATARTNAALPTSALEQVAPLDAESRSLLKRAVDGMALSARGVHRTLRVARTIADLEGARAVSPSAVAEALSYRSQLGE